MIDIERVCYKGLAIKERLVYISVQEYAKCLLAINHRVTKDFSDISARY